MLRDSLENDILAGDGNIEKLFYSALVPEFYSLDEEENLGYHIWS